MRWKAVVRDILCVEGVRMLATLGMLIGAVLLFLPCIAIGFDSPDSLAAAAGGMGVASAVLYGIFAKKGILTENPFSCAPLLRYAGSIAMAATAYVLRCVLWIGGGTVGIQINTYPLGGYLLCAFLFPVMNGLCVDVFGVQYFQRRRYSLRAILSIFVSVDLLYGVLDVFLRPTGTQMLANPVAWMTLFAAGIECVLMTLLFIRSRSICGRILISFLNLVISPTGQMYSLEMWLIEILFCACLMGAVFVLIRTGRNEKTA